MSRGVESLAQRFLREHPEWASECRIDRVVGPLMKTDCLIAFTNWAVEKQLCDPVRAARLREAIVKFTEQQAGTDKLA
jgi:hypothetical protein